MRRRETECAGWRLDDDHLGLGVPLLLLCAQGNQFSAKELHKNGAILKENRRADFQMRLPWVLANPGILNLSRCVSWNAIG